MTVDEGPVASIAARSKRVLRRAVDRVVLPYVEQVAAAVRKEDPHMTGAPVDGTSGVPVAPPTDVPSEFFHMALHELRTVELDRLRGSYERVVSVGASGRWYFDWFERSVGEVAEHVGVEAFEEEPDDLPPYVRWNATTADRFDGLDDQNVDIVYAGQTTEHLWAEELTGFLLQARRVLRGSGLLVLDSPNRLVTEHLDWSHGGHTVELSPAEITELVGLAGFRVESMRGVWRCRFGDELLELEERLTDGPMLVRRITDGPDHPDDCFVWWLVATPAGEPAPAALARRVGELYERHWPTRVSRGMWPGPTHDGPSIAPGSTLRVQSLPFMLREGRWALGLQLAEGSTDDVGAVEVRLLLPGGHVVHSLTRDMARVTTDRFEWEFDQPELMFALAISVELAAVRRPVRLAMPLPIGPAAHGSA
jgi:hypothetical protein